MLLWRNDDFSQARLELTRRPELRTIYTDRARWLEEWLNRDVSGEEKASSPSTRDVLRLLATPGWLERMDRSTVSEWLNLSDLRQQLESRMAKPTPQESLADLFNVDEWLERLRRLEKSVSDLSEIRDRDAESLDLLEWLDDAELALATVSRRGLTQVPRPRNFGDDLLRCALLLQSHPDLFLSCSGWIQATAGGFRPDIEDDPFLGPSAMKFIVLLDELERFEAFTNGSTLPEIDEDRSAELAELRKQSNRLRKLMGRSGEPEVQEEPELVGASSWHAEPLLAARGVPERSQSTELVFDSPDGKYRGQVLIPGRLARGVQVKAGFFAIADGRPASALLGRFAKIGDEQAMIDVHLDGEVVAVFSLATVLKALSGTPRLIVDEEEWKTSK